MVQSQQPDKDNARKQDRSPTQTRVGLHLPVHFNTPCVLFELPDRFYPSCRGPRALRMIRMVEVWGRI